MSDGETDDFELWSEDEMEEMLESTLELDPEEDYEWVIEFDPDDDANLDFTYEHAGIILH